MAFPYVFFSWSRALQAAFNEEVKPEAKAPKVLEVGSLVILQGLKSAPELNEQKGEIEAWHIGTGIWTFQAELGIVALLRDSLGSFINLKLYTLLCTLIALTIKRQMILAEIHA